jgi:hypothetical protein
MDCPGDDEMDSPVTGCPAEPFLQALLRWAALPITKERLMFFIHPDDESGGLATQAEAAQEYGRNAGMDDPDREWILTPWDSWERNPFYTGPRGRHPEDDDYDSEIYGPFKPVSYADDEIPY